MQSIPFSSIIFGQRERTVYDNIDLLAQSIRDVGLQCPLILSPTDDPTKFRLEDGGRRYSALESLGITELYYGATSDPLRPGYVLKSSVSTNESAWLTELTANLHREDFPWQDALRLIVKAWRVRKREADLRGEQLYYGMFGKLLGNYSHSDINAAVNVHDAVQADPEKFANCTSITHAYQLLLNDTRKTLEAELAKRRLAVPKVSVIVPADGSESSGVQATPEPRQIDLSPFMLGNSIDYLEGAAPIFDHIICDPDFAISVDTLSSNSTVAHLGVVQSSVEDSLDDLQRFIRAAFTKTAPSGFLIFWYDLDHHEKIQSWCRQAGWAVQRWPIIWHKVGFASNGAPQYNTAKNIEYAMVCRKPGATLAKVQTSSVISATVGTTSQVLGHPFAKPESVWHFLFALCASPGQSVFDPFMGAGSMPLAARSFGLRPSGMELNPDHYNRAIVNLS